MPEGFIGPPSQGWNTRDPVTGMRPGFAPILDNYIIEAGAPRVRRGYRVWATGLPGPVGGLLAWNGAGAARRLFAGSGTGIFECTATGPVGAAVVTSLTSARWSGINMAAAGGNFLFAFNGADTAQTFDGTTWAAWAGTGVTGGVSWAGTLSGRLFVGNATRLSFFYGGAGAINGAFTEFPLQGIATRGGGIIAMATLSGDGGAGPRSLSVFITSEGEAVVYSGTDPATNFAFVGRWRVGLPIGAPHRCVAAVGGDALLLTTAGVVPLSALQTGEDASGVLDRVGTVRRIAPTWRNLAIERTALVDWNIAALPGLGLTVMNVPWGASAAQQLVVSEGGAVSRWVGLPAANWIEAMGGRVFAGDVASGRVLLFGEDDADGGLGVRSEAMTVFAMLGGPSRTKRVQLIQPIMRGLGVSSLAAGVVVDWNTPTAASDAAGPAQSPPALPAIPGGGTLIWDVGQWDVNLWGGDDSGVTRFWRAGVGVGHAVAVRVAMVSGLSRPTWLGTNIAYEVGGVMR